MELWWGHTDCNTGVNQGWTNKPSKIWRPPCCCGCLSACLKLAFFPLWWCTKSTFYNLLNYPVSIHAEIFTIPSVIKPTWAGFLWFLVKSRYTYPVFPETCHRILFTVVKFSRVSLWQCFQFQLFSSTKTKPKKSKMKWPHSTTDSWRVNPSICWGGRRVWVSGAALCVSARQPDRCLAPWDLWEASVKQSITFETAFWLTAAPITKSGFQSSLVYMGRSVMEKRRQGWGWDTQGEKDMGFMELCRTKNFKLCAAPQKLAAVQK